MRLTETIIYTVNIANAAKNDPHTLRCQAARKHSLAGLRLETWLMNEFTSLVRNLRPTIIMSTARTRGYMKNEQLFEYT